MRLRPKHVLLSSVVAVAIGLTACGDDGGSDDAQLSSSTEAPGGGGGLVQTGETDLGPVLTTSDGFTLYAFTNDTNGTSTCEADCADAWPPLLVDSAELPEGLDPNVFTVVPRSDGTFQLSAANQPLYRFAGDSAPGDTNGQGSGGVWFAVSPDGQLVQGDAGSAGAGAGTDTGDNPSTTSTTSSGSDGGDGYGY